MSDAAVWLENVSVKLGDQYALESISLEIPCGSFAGIIGPNGAGKTTLLRLIIGLLKPEQGRVKLFGCEMTPRKPWCFPVGYLPQRKRAVEDFPVTGLDVVAMGCMAGDGFWWRRPAAAEAAREALKLVGAEEYALRPLRELSGGEQQLIFLARAICKRPRLLLLDEPTAGLDFIAQDRFYRVVKRLYLDWGMTVVVVSHDLHGLADCVEELIYINKKLYAVGSPQQVLSSFFESNAGKLAYSPFCW